MSERDWSLQATLSAAKSHNRLTQLLAGASAEQNLTTTRDGEVDVPVRLTIFGYDHVAALVEFFTEHERKPITLQRRQTMSVSGDIGTGEDFLVDVDDRSCAIQSAGLDSGEACEAIHYITHDVTQM